MVKIKLTWDRNFETNADVATHFLNTCNDSCEILLLRVTSIVDFVVIR